jgi:hypothetical protein
VSSWIQRIQHVIDNEPVDAGATGRPTRQLEQNLQNLKDLVELSLLGEALVAHDIALDPTLSVGQPVYWNAENARAEAALASVVFDPDLQTLIGTPMSQVLGVLWRKSGASAGDVVLVGYVPLDISAALDEAEQSGRYFLSGVTPGKLMRSRASLSVPVLFSTGDGRVLVFPQWRQWAEDHEHFRIDLICAPAGDTVPPDLGERHEITDADASLSGWLPAGHASFAGKAPSGAAFGYNIAAHPALRRLWPPFPPTAATLIWDKGLDHLGGTEVPPGLAVIDRNGIWWMSNCYGDVPWPVEFTFADGESTDGVSESESLTCPRPEAMLLTIYFSRVLYEANKTVVTSLRAAEGSIIRVYGCDGEPARTGDLIVDADLALAIDQQDAEGHLVLKNIVDDKFKRGPVVAGVVIAGDGLEATSTAPHTQDDDSVLHQGVITLSLAADPTDRELAPIVTRLRDTKERYENGVLYIGFPVGYVSSVLRVYQVPPAGIGADNPLEFRFTLLGTAAGALPALTAAYRVIPRGTATPAALPSSDTALTLGSVPTLSAGNRYIEVVSDPITVDPGDTVQLILTRSASDGYSGEVGLIRAAAVLLPPT